MGRLAPRVKLHEDGTVTVSGLHARDLKDILTAASLHHMESESKWVPTPEEGEYVDIIRWNNYGSRAWFKRLTFVIDHLCTCLDDKIRAPYRRKIDTKEERLVKVTSDKRFRLMIEKVIKDAIEKRKKAINGDS
jgi:hypothetical protein